MVELTRLIRRGGRYRMTVWARTNWEYAVYGVLPSETDARATAMRLSLDRWVYDERLAHDLARTRRAIGGLRGWAGRVWESLRARRSGLVITAPASFANPLSQMCTLGQMQEPDYDRWLARLGFAKTLHRKQWEFLYILRVLETRNMIAPGRRGLGFGVGGEYLPTFLASAGCLITATDLPDDTHGAALWRESGQHASANAGLQGAAPGTDDTLSARIDYRPVDMNAIPDDLTGFDFCWSACAYEHLGSIEAGLRFVRRSLDCLRPGGIAVHTSELNLSSNHRTIDDSQTVLFRRRDMIRLARDLIAEGHEVTPITFDMGDQPSDHHIDMPPYSADAHLKLALMSYVTTSFGLIVRKGG